MKKQRIFYSTLGVLYALYALNTTAFSADRVEMQELLPSHLGSAYAPPERGKFAIVTGDRSVADIYNLKVREAGWSEPKGLPANLGMLDPSRPLPRDLDLGYRYRIIECTFNEGGREHHWVGEDQRVPFPHHGQWLPSRERYSDDTFITEAILSLGVKYQGADQEVALLPISRRKPHRSAETDASPTDVLYEFREGQLWRVNTLVRRLEMLREGTTIPEYRRVGARSDTRPPGHEDSNLFTTIPFAIRQITAEDPHICDELDEAPDGAYLYKQEYLEAASRHPLARVANKLMIYSDGRELFLPRITHTVYTTSTSSAVPAEYRFTVISYRRSKPTEIRFKRGVTFSPFSYRDGEAEPVAAALGVVPSVLSPLPPQGLYVVEGPNAGVERWREMTDAGVLGQRGVEIKIPDSFPRGTSSLDIQMDMLRLDTPADRKAFIDNWSNRSWSPDAKVPVSLTTERQLWDDPELSTFFRTGFRREGLPAFLPSAAEERAAQAEAVRRQQAEEQAKREAEASKRREAAEKARIDEERRVAAEQQAQREREKLDCILKFREELTDLMHKGHFPRQLALHADKLCLSVPHLGIGRGDLKGVWADNIAKARKIAKAWHDRQAEEQAKKAAEAKRIAEEQARKEKAERERQAAEQARLGPLCRELMGSPHQLGVPLLCPGMPVQVRMRLMTSHADTAHVHHTVHHSLGTVAVVRSGNATVSVRVRQ